MPVDYSKWDRMDYGDSSDDDENGHTENDSGYPKVMRLDEPSRVTRTADGELVVENQEIDSKRKQGTRGNQESQEKNVAGFTRTSSEDPSPDTSAPPAAWTEKGGRTNYGNDSKTLYWQQDRNCVTLRIELPPITNRKGLDCSVEGILKYCDRECAVGDSKNPTLVLRDGSNTLFSEMLPHAVHAEGDDDYDYLDWSIISYSSSLYLQVTLLKAVPMPGMTHWWRKPLNCIEEEIELDWRADKNQEFRQAWQEAHEKFRSKISSSSPTEV